MPMLKALAIAGICASLVLAACGDDDEPTVEPATEAATGASAGDDAGTAEPAGNGNAGQPKPDDATAKPGIAITTAESQFGEILFDGEERAIYLFDKESGPESECYGACAEAWPPVLTDGVPSAEGGADAKLLGTTERDDGTTQVTYDGRPLYYYVDDPPGEVLCHNVVEFGGLWLVVQPSGDPAPA